MVNAPLPRESGGEKSHECTSGGRHLIEGSPRLTNDILVLEPTEAQSIASNAIRERRQSESGFLASTPAPRLFRELRTI